MFGHAHYVAVMRTKRAERSALRALDPNASFTDYSPVRAAGSIQLSRLPIARGRQSIRMPCADCHRWRDCVRSSAPL